MLLDRLSTLRRTIAVFTVLLACSAAYAQREAPDEPQEEADTEGGVEVLNRGPVHEAFAEVVQFAPEPGVIVSKEVPDAIEELPPDQKPDGDDIAWIPGYWAFDDERKDFLWISGVWRALPPGRQWVPGYWTKVDNGSQWVSGYWAGLEVEEVQYLPEPPESLERGPSSPAPTADSIWVPGSWMWHENRYAWRPGYWIVPQPDWVWVPASYYWSPLGYVFNDGYWDCALNRRGALFAPVYFTGGGYRRANFTYTPAYAINLTVFTNHLFLRPTYGHYYFGDYYATNYSRAGFYPWFAFHKQHRHGYDPLFASAQWQHRSDKDWSTNLQTRYQTFQKNESGRPPRTVALNAKEGRSGDNSLLIVAPLAEVSKRKENSLNWQPLAKEERQQLATRSKEFREFGQQRLKLEGEQTGKADSAPGRAAKARGMKLARSPISAAPSDGKGEGKKQARTPPKAPAAPKVDLKVQPEGTAEGTKTTRRRPSSPDDADAGDAKTLPNDADPEDVPKPRKGITKPGSRPDQPKGEPKVKPTDPGADLPESVPPKGKPDQPKRGPKVKPQEPVADLPKSVPPEDKPRSKPDQPKREPKVKPQGPGAPDGDSPPVKPKLKPNPPANEPKSADSPKPLPKKNEAPEATPPKAAPNPPTPKPTPSPAPAPKTAPASPPPASPPPPVSPSPDKSPKKEKDKEPKN